MAGDIDPDSEAPGLGLSYDAAARAVVARIDTGVPTSPITEAWLRAALVSRGWGNFSVLENAERRLRFRRGGPATSSRWAARRRHSC